LNRILKYISSGGGEQTPRVYGLILEKQGSAPQVTGASAIFSADGVSTGTLGGGVLEFEASRRASEILGSSKALIFSYEFNANISDSEGAICGGVVRILLDAGYKRDSRVFGNIETSLEKGIPGVLVTRIEQGKGDMVSLSREWLPANTVNSRIPYDGGAVNKDELNLSLDKKVAQLVEKEDVWYFIEPLYPLPELVIVGAGHIGQALAHLGNLLDFSITIIDDRPDFANSTRFPGAERIIVDDVAKAVKELQVTDDTYIVIMTTGHSDDSRALRECIGSGAAYIGMIGSKRKISLVREEFIRQGWASPEQFDSVHAPIGLPIPSKTIQEIAISIAAELIVARKKAGDDKKIINTWSVILAAGESKRMKEQKLLMKYGKSSIIETVVQKNLDSKVNGVMVVLGADHEEVAAKIKRFRVGSINNEEYTMGMFSSVRKGVSALPPEADSVIISLGDQPMINSGIINDLIDLKKGSSKGIILPVYKRKRGHPVLISRKYFSEIAGMPDSATLRDVISGHRDDIAELQVDSDNILRDIDTREQYNNELMQ
jgi:xanthine dehydrogenase accessory factor